MEDLIGLFPQTPAHVPGVVRRITPTLRIAVPFRRNGCVQWAFAVLTTSADRVRIATMVAQKVNSLEYKDGVVTLEVAPIWDNVSECRWYGDDIPSHELFAERETYKAKFTVAAPHDAK